jgi:hypothetical protein
MLEAVWNFAAEEFKPVAFSPEAREPRLLASEVLWSLPWASLLPLFWLSLVAVKLVCAFGA